MFRVLETMINEFEDGDVYNNYKCTFLLNSQKKRETKKLIHSANSLSYLREDVRVLKCF